MEKNYGVQLRQLAVVLIFSLLICGTAGAYMSTMTTNGYPYILEIRDQDNPSAIDEINTWNRELDGDYSMKSSVRSAIPEYQSQPSLSDGQKILAYGYYRDMTGAVHEFEYDMSPDTSRKDNNDLSAQASSWVEQIDGIREETATSASIQNEDWPVVLTKTHHTEMQPYGKLTTVWELRKKAVSSAGKADFAVRTHVVIEPGVHAWPQSSKWSLDDTQPFMDVTHDWTKCTNNLTVNSFVPAKDILGRQEKSLTLQLLPSPGFSYLFTKPELTLIGSDLSPNQKTNIWNIDLYAHGENKRPDQINQAMMPASSAEVDMASSNVTVNLMHITTDGYFIDGMNSWGIEMGDTIQVKT